MTKKLTITSIVVFTALAASVLFMFSCEKTEAAEKVNKTKAEKIAIIEITTEQEWCDLVLSYNGNRELYADYVYVKVLDTLTVTGSLGTESRPFNGEIDFNGNELINYEPVVSIADNAKISNAHISQISDSPHSSLIETSLDTAVFADIIINGAVFNQSILIKNGYSVNITNTNIQNAIVYDYEQIGGLVGDCKELKIENLTVECLSVTPMIFASVYMNGALIANTAETITIENTTIKKSTVFAKSLAAGLAVRCNKLNIKDFCLSDTVITSYTGIGASGLISSGLDELTQDNLKFENVTLTAASTDPLGQETTGDITADPDSDYYKK